MDMDLASYCNYNNCISSIDLQRQDLDLQAILYFCQTLPISSELESFYIKLQKNLHVFSNKILDQQSESLRAEKLLSLHQWLQLSNLSEINRISLSRFSEGFGLKAECPVKKHDCVLRIPRKVMLTHEDALMSSCGAFFKTDPLCSKMPNVCLALYLLVHKHLGKDSPYAAYINSLPSSYTNVLYFETQHFLRLKCAVYVQECIVQHSVQIARQFAYFKQLLLSDKSVLSEMIHPDSFSYNAYQWAVATVMSRNNNIPSSCSYNGGNKNILALVPYWDMGNHKIGELTTDFDTDSDSLIFYAMEDVAEGEQVYFMYGSRSNTELLLYSGFVIRDNPYDEYILKLGLNLKDKFITERNALLEIVHLKCTETFKLLIGNEVAPSLAAFCRVFVATKSDLDGLLHGDMVNVADFLLSPLTSPEQISDLNHRALLFLVNRLKLLLASLTKQIANIEPVSNDPIMELCDAFLSSQLLVLQQLVTLFSKLL